MKFYVKPSMNVIELQLNENIAAVPTTVFKASSREAAQEANTAKLYDMVMSNAGSGMDYSGS